LKPVKLYFFASLVMLGILLGFIYFVNHIDLFS